MRFIDGPGQRFGLPQDVPPQINELQDLVKNTASDIHNFLQDDVYGSVMDYLDTLGASYDEVLSIWDTQKNYLRDANSTIGLQDNASGWIARNTAFARELGFGLIDTGLWLGGLAVSENVRADLFNGVELVANELSQFDFSNGDIRFSVNYQKNNIDHKFFLGSDISGYQLKTNIPGEFAQAARYSFDYEKGFVSDLLIERNFTSNRLPLSAQVNGVRFNSTVVTGVRHNLTGENLRGAINLDFKSKSFKALKFSLELRTPNVPTNRKL